MFDKLIPWKRNNGHLKVRQDDLHPIAKLRNDFESLWDRWLDDIGVGLSSRVNFNDDEKEYVMRAELPGFEPEDIDIKVSGNVLTVRAEHTEEGKEKNGSFKRYGSFYESYTLPRGVHEDRIDARYHSGVLEVHLPKSEECQAKRIAVKSA